MRAFAKAEKEMKPAVGTMFDGIYEELTPDLKEQKAELKRFLTEYPNEYKADEFEGGLKGFK